MADLTGKTIANGYPNLVTIGATTNDNPTSGTLENGKGNNLTSVTFDGAVVVNESGGNNDFRVEGDTDQNLIVADASADNVGIGTSTPSWKLSVHNPTANTAQDVLVKISTAYDATVVDRSAGIVLGGAEVSAGSKEFIVDTFSSQDFFNSAIYRVYRGDNASKNDFVIDANGEVGIGTTSPAKELDVNGEIRASGGILFGSDTAAANTLDDYEEGTWTPVYEPQTGSFTTMTMAVNSATYTKIGRQVTVQAWVKTSNVDVTGASGFLFIGGLPFTSLGSISVAGISVGNSTGWSSTANSPDSGVITASSTSIRLQKTNATAISVVSDLRTGAISDQNDLRFTATYFT